MKEFNKALSNFVHDVASGGAVRHLADAGYSISEIAAQLDYPLPKEKIAAVMWEHFLNTGKICLEEPKEVHEKVRFVKEQDAYGKISFRKVVETVDNTERKYVLCEYGKALYQKKPEFLQFLDSLEPGDREYIELLQWPLHPVYHELDERMQRIQKKYGK